MMQINRLVFTILLYYIDVFVIFLSILFSFKHRKDEDEFSFLLFEDLQLHENALWRILSTIASVTIKMLYVWGLYIVSRVAHPSKVICQAPLKEDNPHAM